MPLAADTAAVSTAMSSSSSSPAKPAALPAPFAGGRVPARPGAPSFDRDFFRAARPASEARIIARTTIAGTMKAAMLRSA